MYNIWTDVIYTSTISHTHTHIYTHTAHTCLSFFSCFCNKICCQEQLQGEWGYFRAQLRITVHHGGEVKAAGAKSSRSCHIHSQGAVSNEHILSFLSPFIKPQPGNGGQSRWEFLSQMYNQDHPPNAGTEVQF